MKTWKPWLIMALALTLIMGLASCKKTEEKEEATTTNVETSEKQNTEVSEETATKLKDDFDIIKEDAKAVSTDLYKFVEENKAKLNEGQVDLMMEDILASAKKDALALNELIQREDVAKAIAEVKDGVRITKEHLEKISDNKIKEELLAKYQDTLVILQGGEGSLVGAVDYSKLLAVDSMGHEWKDYLTILSQNQEKPALVDASLAIPFKELGERLANIEKYLSSYGKTQRSQELSKDFENMLRTYLKGIDNTPIAEAGKLKEEVKEAYEASAANDKTIVGQTISRYLEVLKAKNFVIDDEVLKGADRLLENALNLMKKTK
ncbi:MAG: hypothetical protein GXZ11_06500 [Tissierellia bacterium]|nr:hypothetical protein [Tissierellia bacterium]